MHKCHVVHAAVVLLGAFAASAAVARDDGLARAYAGAMAAAVEAQRDCTDMVPDESRLFVLRERAGLSDSETDDAFLSAEFAKLKPDLQRAVLNLGAKAWCERAWSAFGPRGFGTIRRP